MAEEPSKINSIIISGWRSSDVTIDSEDHSESEFVGHCNSSIPSATIIGDPRCLMGLTLKSCVADKTKRNSSPASKMTVRFDKVEFREYSIILSDNTCISAGPPVGLGWRYDPKDTFESDIDSYEDYRDGSATRRTKYDIRIPPEVRVGMLLEAGFSPQEIKSAVRGVKEDQERRNASLRYRTYDLILERIERLKNGVKRMTPRRAKGSCSRADRRGS